MKREAQPVVCGFCARAFVEESAQPVCRACPLGPSCRARRCPYCGYENPLPPSWLDRVARWRKRDGIA